MAWRWTAWRLGVSAFILFHISATLLWVLPPSELKSWLAPQVRWYMIPMALWQSWGMFAPDPLQVTLELESDVVDSKGLHHIHEFTKVAELSWWQKLPLFRHPKLASNLLIDEYQENRKFVARYAVRKLGIAPENFPVNASLYYKVTNPPPLGSSEPDLMAPKQFLHLATYDFPSREEVER